MKQLTKQLNQQVANFGVLYTKLHYFHWFVEGPQFKQLHEFFEALYDETTNHLDAVAERLLMLGEKPLATLKEFLEFASIKEASGKFTGTEMFEQTMNDFKMVDKEIKETIKVAQGLEDEVTVDLLIGIAASLQKHIWFINASLK